MNLTQLISYYENKLLMLQTAGKDLVSMSRALEIEEIIIHLKNL